MRLTITNEYHFLRGPDGVYTDAMHPWAYYARYLSVFDRVSVMARVRDGALPPDCKRVDGDRIDVIAVPEFVGVRGLAGVAPQLAQLAWRVARDAEAVILRSPGVMSSALHVALQLQRKPYGIAVVGDPQESLRSGDRIMRRLPGFADVLLRRQVAHAAASLYVTEQQLQQRYPPRPGTVSLSASNVDVPDDVLDQPLAPTRAGPVLALAFIGSLERPYKGLDVLLAALARTQRPHRLDVIGEGVLRRGLEREAERLGLAERVHFRGRLLPGPPVFAFLREHDALIVPSRTEGMPRVLLEAMAVGLPVLASSVGGIPEVVGAGERVPADDPAALARAIDALADDPARRQALARANRETARRYRHSVLDERRRRFFEAVRVASIASARL